MEELELFTAVAKFYRQNISLTDILTDDGAKPVEKAEGLALLGGTVGAAGSLGYGISMTRSLVASIPRMLYGGGYGALLGGTYVSAVHVTAKLRNQDTPFNHLVGGMATGFLMGAKARSQMVGWRAAVVLGLAGFFLKDCQKCGITIVPKRVLQTQPRVKTFNPYSYRNVETYDPEKSFLTQDVSEVVRILEENKK